MNETGIVGIRLEGGSTQENSPTSGLGVPVREPFVTIDDGNLTSRADSLEHRVNEQQAKRDNAWGALRRLVIGPHLDAKYPLSKRPDKR